MLVWARCKLLSIQVLMIVCILSMYVIVHVAQVARPQESQHSGLMNWPEPDFFSKTRHRDGSSVLSLFNLIQ